LKGNEKFVPSHGRGRRFNPYSAHHLNTSIGDQRLNRDATHTLAWWRARVVARIVPPRKAQSISHRRRLPALKAALA